MTRSAAAMAVSEGRSTAYQEGYRKGLTGSYAPNPWDGRTKAGRDWRRGYTNGMNDRNEVDAQMVDRARKALEESHGR